MSACEIPNQREEVLALLASNYTYQEVANLVGRSRGYVWKIAAEAGARKNEARIKDRARRLQEQLAMLEELKNQTVTADVLEFLREIPDESVATIIPSPPYNIGKGYQAHDDRLRHVYYCGWMMQVVSECARVLKPGGTIALEVGVTRKDDGTRIPLHQIFFPMLVDAGLTWQNTITWVAPHGLTPKKRCADRHEDILIFSKGEPVVFNATPARTPQKNPAKRAFRGPNKGELSGCPLGAHPTDVWADVDHVRHNTPEFTGHPAQFSLALAKRLMSIYSMPGDLTMDMFSGTGTVQLAAFILGREFVGADLSYADIRAKRLAGAEPDRVCVFPGVSAESAAIWNATATRVESMTLFDGTHER